MLKIFSKGRRHTIKRNNYSFHLKLTFETFSNLRFRSAFWRLIKRINSDRLGKSRLIDRGRANYREALSQNCIINCGNGNDTYESITRSLVIEQNVDGRGEIKEIKQNAMQDATFGRRCVIEQSINLIASNEANADKQYVSAEANQYS